MDCDRPQNWALCFFFYGRMRWKSVLKSKCKMWRTYSLPWGGHNYWNKNKLLGNPFLNCKNSLQLWKLKWYERKTFNFNWKPCVPLSPHDLVLLCQLKFKSYRIYWFFNDCWLIEWVLELQEMKQITFNYATLYPEFQTAKCFQNAKLCINSS